MAILFFIILTAQGFVFNEGFVYNQLHSLFCLAGAVEYANCTSAAE